MQVFLNDNFDNDGHGATETIDFVVFKLGMTPVMPLNLTQSPLALRPSATQSHLITKPRTRVLRQLS